MWQSRNWVPNLCFIILLYAWIYDWQKYKDPSLLASERGTGLVSSGDNTSSGVVKKASSQAQIKDDTSMEGMLSAFYYEC